MEVEEELPTSCNLDALKSNARLRRFAELMAQNNEGQRRKRKKIKITPHETQRWVAATPDEIMLTNGPGSRGGSATILDVPSGSSSTGGKSQEAKGRSQADKALQPLDQRALDAASNRLFNRAINEMRKTGAIVIFSAEEDDELDKESTVGAEGNCPEETSFDIWTMPQSRQDSSIYQFNDDDTSMATPKASKISDLGGFHSDGFNFGPAFNGEEQETPRASARPGIKANLFATSRPRYSSSSLSTLASTTRPRSPGNLSDASWSTTRIESDVESFKLVTSDYAAKKILRVIKHEKKNCQSRGGRHAPFDGLSEEAIRKIMSVDSRWEAVARHSPVIKTALDKCADIESIRTREGVNFYSTLQ